MEIFVSLWLLLIFSGVKENNNNDSTGPVNGKIDTTILVRVFRVFEILPMPTFSLACFSLAG